LIGKEEGVNENFVLARRTEQRKSDRKNARTADLLLAKNDNDGQLLKLAIPATAPVGLASPLKAAYPRAVMMMAPGYWKRMPERRPPGIPFLTTPMAKENCVEVGPGRHWQSARISMKRPALIHLSFSTNVCCVWGTVIGRR
jgi:hypothetical protein